MKARDRARSGFTLVEIMIVVAIIGLLAAIAIPNFVRARRRAQTNTCIENLRQMDSAKQQWALEYKKVDTDTLALTDLVPYLQTPGLPVCPGKGTYVVTVVAAPPTCTVPGHTFN